MLQLEAEVRGVAVVEGNGAKGPYRRVFLVVETADFASYQVELTDDHIRAGWESQLPALRGKRVIVPVSCRAYKDKVYYRYANDRLPQIVTAAAAKPATAA